MSVKQLVKIAAEPAALEPGGTASIIWDYKVGSDPITLPKAITDTSMVSSTEARRSLYPRDDIILDWRAAPKPGQIVLVFDPESHEHLFRVIEFPTRTKARFVALNPAFPAFELPADSHHILGVVVAVKRVLE